MGGAGKSGNNRRNRHRYSAKKNESSQKQDFDRSKDQGRNNKRDTENLFNGSKPKKGSAGFHERPVWTAPQAPSEPIPAYICPWCKQPIKDISTAISDKTSGLPVHFDCVLARLNQSEALESHDTICYLGGGRFGVVRSSSSPDAAGFKIKKIFEWEEKDNHGEWRRNVSDHFSVT